MNETGSPPPRPRLAVGVLVRRRGQVLLVQRKYPPAAGRWALPGGSVRAGETLRAAAEREVREETGIRVYAGEAVHFFELMERQSDGQLLYHYVIIDLLAEYRGGRVQAGDDAREARWFTPAEAEALPLHYETRALLRRHSVTPASCGRMDSDPGEATLSRRHPFLKKDDTMDKAPGKRTKPRTGKAFLAGDIPLLHETMIDCPYCGERFHTSIDGSAGNQEYYEDCEVCCRPILIRSEIDSDGNIERLYAAREDD